MTWLAVIGVLLWWTTGVCIVLAAWPKRTDSLRWYGAIAALGWLVGTSLASMVYFGVRCVGSPSAGVLVAIDAIVLGASLVVMRQIRARREVIRVDDVTPTLTPRLKQFGGLVRCLVCWAAPWAIIAIAAVLWHKPHGPRDAWAQWNVKAKFMHTAGDLWQQHIANLGAAENPDYPLLLPATVARTWHYLGAPVTYPQVFPGPGSVAMLFAIATGVLLFGTLLMLRRQLQACIAALALVGTWAFVDQAGWQYADVPVGAYMLATCACVVLWRHFGESGRGLLALAAFCALSAAWTKNEGIVFCVAMVIGAAAVRLYLCYGLRNALPAGQAVPRRDSLQPNRTWAFVVTALVIAVPVLCLVLVRLRLQMVSDALARLSFESLGERLADGARYKLIAAGAWSAVIKSPMYALVAVYAIVAGRDRNHAYRRVASVFFITAAIMLLAYVALCLLTTYDPALYVTLTLHRVLLQLWPATLLMTFLVIRHAED
jgi:hypothetical protein